MLSTGDLSHTMFVHTITSFVPFLLLLKSSSTFLSEEDVKELKRVFVDKVLTSFFKKVDGFVTDEWKGGASGWEFEGGVLTLHINIDCEKDVSDWWDVELLCDSLDETLVESVYECAITPTAFTKKNGELDFVYVEG